MPEPSKPKIRVFLKTGQTREPEPPKLRFIRWKLVPLPAEVPIEADVHEAPASWTRTP